MLQRRAHESRRSIKHFHEDWGKLLKENGVGRAGAEQVNIISQLCRQVEFLLGICEHVSFFTRQPPCYGSTIPSKGGFSYLSSDPPA